MTQHPNLADHIIVLSDKDNVAVALVDLPAGDYLYGRGGESIHVPQAIQAGFKLAIADIGESERIVKYGHVIGLAKTDIKRGDCVHVHNLISSV